MSKTKVIIRAEDGREFSRTFESYAEAAKFIAEVKELTGVSLQLKEYQATKEPTVEVYREKDAP